MIAILQSILFGIVEGITEWLPISSTGHMILLDEIWPMQVSESFKNMFLVVIQLGAILAVVVVFWHQIWPFTADKSKHYIKKDIWSMWFKVLFACIPAGVIGLKWDDEIEALFYNYKVVSIMLILVGILFIIAENRNKHHEPTVNSIAELSYGKAFIIGIFQLVAAVFPGTSRSGSTILGGLMLGVSRQVSAEFTFYLAIPAMFGASVLKIFKHGLAFTTQELAILLIGSVVAFIVSILIIRFLMSYIKKHDFKIFGWYRIVLGIIVLAYFAL